MTISKHKDTSCSYFKKEQTNDIFESNWLTCRRLGLISRSITMSKYPQLCETALCLHYVKEQV